MSLKDKQIYEFEGFRFDLGEQTLWYQEEPVQLPPRVLETLAVLVENKGRLMTKDELMNEIWGGTVVEERNLTQNIFTLRKVFREKRKNVKFIETVPRRGYRFVAESTPPEISEEETLAVSRRQKIHITAEGSVSRKDLTEAVREIAGDLLRSENGIAPRRSEPVRKRPFFAFTKLDWILTVAVIALSIFGTSVWLRQNNFFKENALAADTGKNGRAFLEFERLTDSGRAFYPNVSPDRQFVVYTYFDRNKCSIHLQNIATGSKTVVVEPDAREIGRPKFSPDGNYIYFRRNVKIGGPANAYRVPIFGGSPRVIAEDVTGDIGLSPDGRQLAFVRLHPKSNGQQLIVSRTDGSGERVVATRTGGESFAIWEYAPAWSPDGENMLIAVIKEPTGRDAGGMKFVVVRVSDGRSEPLKMPVWDAFLQAEWMPGGESIMFVARERSNEPFQIWQVSYPDGTARRITNDAHDYRYLSVSRDAGFLLATQEKTFYDLWLVPVANPSEGRQLTDTSEAKYGHAGISWTPDGKEIVHTLIENVFAGNLWAIDTKTLKKRQITFDQGRMNLYPNVLPDGRSVVFASNRKNGWHIWRVGLDGSNLRQITNGAGENYPSVTADGRWLIYASPGEQPTALWKKSLVSNEPPVRLTASMGSNAVSPDLANVVVSYLSENAAGRRVSKYGLIPFAPTEQPQPLDFNPFHGSIAWKKDGSGFYWIDDGRDLNNIRFYSLTEKTNRPVTDFRDMKMLRLGLSPDGKVLATARGATVSNIFRIENF
jgi:eukaryotic-like serine/threonine-protein kinase